MGAEPGISSNMDGRKTMDPQEMHLFATSFYEKTISQRLVVTL